MIAIGVGCRKACPAEDIVALVREALALLPEGTMPEAMVSLADKRGEPGLAAAAALLGLPLTFLDRAVLALVAGEARSCSRRVEEMFSLPSVAETAALAGAGQGAVLLVPRRASATATCAIAGAAAPFPLVGRGKGWGSSPPAPSSQNGIDLALDHEPPSPALPHKGEGDVSAFPKPPPGIGRRMF